MVYFIDSVSDCFDYSQIVLMSNLQSVSIIAAFPIGMVMILIVISFFKDVEKYKKDLDNSQKQTK